ncbi:MAG: PIG-L family deacetylase, partial [Opitutaceae bacterium]
LDWLADTDKVAMDASASPALAEKLVAIFDSQIAGGKRYDLAAMGRRLANATFFASHATDTTHAVSFAMDLTPLVTDDKLSVRDFTLAHVDKLRADVAGLLEKMG